MISARRKASDVAILNPGKEHLRIATSFPNSRGDYGEVQNDRYLGAASENVIIDSE